ncbi:hypothetical protein ACFO6R_05740 [Eubacterium multiforme]|uniref:Uncharacterized protein n=1 Tax=Eubacterium multiforme TaxID=83339 RepID=A0ABT9US18_9FIRM|nr:hypothetical protein [Eubacterium multiforme]MDQ0149084.1 hypothetical protein [Eubacterium multiforme]
MNKSIKILMITSLSIIFSVVILNKFFYTNKVVETISNNKENWNSITITEDDNLIYSKINSSSKLKLEKIEYNKLNYSYVGYNGRAINKFGTLDSIGDNIWVGYVNDNLYGITYCKVIIDNEYIKIHNERLNKNCITIEMFKNSNNKITESFNYNLKDNTKEFILDNKKGKTKIDKIKFL